MELQPNLVTSKHHQQSLSVLKTVTCTPTMSSLQPACDAILEGTSIPEGQITPDEFNITVTGNNPNPSQFNGSSTAVVVTLDPGPYNVTDIGYPSVSEALFDVIAAFPTISTTVQPQYFQEIVNKYLISSKEQTEQLQRENHKPVI